MSFNYSQICSTLVSLLPSRQKEVISRRFALGGSPESETLESIGKNFKITRERVRQIERDSLLALREEAKKYQKVLQSFKDYLETHGGVREEKTLLADLGETKDGNGGMQNQVYFLLNLGNDFQRFGETKKLRSFWSMDPNSISDVERIIESFSLKLKKAGKPLSLGELLGKSAAKGDSAANSYLEISKEINKNAEGFFGLKEWPEINPRGVKDKAYLTLKKQNKPLHFRDVASLIPNALPQTVHNELIKDGRFVLVGRGIYALKEWGYQTGFVKDVIFKTLKDAGRPLAKDKILTEVLKQRMVKENTVLLNLSNKKYFSRSGDSYTVREA